MMIKRGSQSGFTLMEMVVGTAVSLVVVSMAFTLISYYITLGNKAYVKMDNILEQSLGNEFLWLDLKYAAPSLNNLDLLDDNGKGFFDYTPDVAVPAATASRTFTITPANGKVIYFLLQDKNAGESILYDPSRAYDYTYSTSPDKTTDGTMTYGGMNKGNGRGKGSMDAQNPNLFKDGNLILMAAPALLRQPGSDPNTTLPKYHAHLCRPNRGGGNCQADKGPGGCFKSKHPLDPTIDVDSEQTFFNTLPSLSGGSHMVMIQGVKMIRYYIAQTGVGTNNLMKDTWNGSTFVNPVLVYANIQSVTFKRDSIADPEFDYDFVGVTVGTGGIF